MRHDWTKVQLKRDGYSVCLLNGDLEQIDRDQAMIKFANHSRSLLVATDVAARGLDISELPAVINYEHAFEPEVNVHRVGRTGRAGRKGGSCFEYYQFLMIPNVHVKLKS